MHRLYYIVMCLVQCAPFDVWHKPWSEHTDSRQLRSNVERNKKQTNRKWIQKNTKSQEQTVYTAKEWVTWRPMLRYWREREKNKDFRRKSTTNMFVRWLFCSGIYNLKCKIICTVALIRYSLHIKIVMLRPFSHTDSLSAPTFCRNTTGFFFVLQLQRSVCVLCVSERVPTILITAVRYVAMFVFHRMWRGRMATLVYAVRSPDYGVGFSHKAQLINILHHRQAVQSTLTTSDWIPARRSKNSFS